MYSKHEYFINNIELSFFSFVYIYLSFHGADEWMNVLLSFFIVFVSTTWFPYKKPLSFTYYPFESLKHEQFFVTW